MIMNFYGVSDDLIEVEGETTGGYDWGAEYYVGEDDSAYFKVWNDDGRGNVEGIIVGVQYAPAEHSNGWFIGITPLDENRPHPTWPMVLKFGEPAPAYSVLLSLDVPETTQIERLDRTE